MHYVFADIKSHDAHRKNILQFIICYTIHDHFKMLDLLCFTSEERCDVYGKHYL